MGFELLQLIQTLVQPADQPKPDDAVTQRTLTFNVVCEDIAHSTCDTKHEIAESSMFVALDRRRTSVEREDRRFVSQSVL